MGRNITLFFLIHEIDENYFTSDIHRFSSFQKDKGIKLNNFNKHFYLFLFYLSLSFTWAIFCIFFFLIEIWQSTSQHHYRHYHRWENKHTHHQFCFCVRSYLLTLITYRFCNIIERKIKKKNSYRIFVEKEKKNKNQQIYEGP